jgi:hypothetical protein
MGSACSSYPVAGNNGRTAIAGAALDLQIYSRRRRAKAWWKDLRHGQPLLVWSLKYLLDTTVRRARNKVLYSLGHLEYRT